MNFSLFIAGCVVGFFTGVVVTANTAPFTPAAKRNAVKQGHAEYYLDNNHDRQFRWLPTPAPKTDSETHSEN